MDNLRLILDAQALAANWTALDRISGMATTGAAVKADAYGLGVERCVRALFCAGCRDFFVAHWEEVGPVRTASGNDAQISVLHGPGDADMARARKVSAKPVLNSVEQVERWKSAGGGRCDIMVDTGINRLGLTLGEAGSGLLDGLDIDICMSHLACADEDHPLNTQQLGRFCGIKKQVSARRFSLANSAGIALGADYAFDLVRPGLALYGGVPRPELSDTIRQVAVPQARVLQIRNVQAGEGIGYNATFTASADMRVGVLAIGYADGYLRSFSNAGSFVSSDGANLPVIGRVSMDLTCVDLSGAPEVGAGDWVDCAYDLPAMAEMTGLSQYELLTNLGTRFSRMPAA